MIFSPDAGKSADIRKDDTNQDMTDAEKAQMWADECMDYLSIYPAAWDAAMRYALGCVRDGRRIETHSLITTMKAAGGKASRFDNNHAPFVRRLLAAASRDIRDSMEFRGSLFDDLDVEHYAQILGNQRRHGGIAG